MSVQARLAAEAEEARLLEIEWRGVRVQGTFLLSIKLMGHDVLERLVTVRVRVRIRVRVRFRVRLRVRVRLS